MDEHVADAVARELRRQGVDVLTVPEADMLGATDQAHLELALAANRVLFTQEEDFLRLHAGGMRHAGIVYTHQGAGIGDIIRGLMLIHEVLEVEDMAGHVEFL